MAFGSKATSTFRTLLTTAAATVPIAILLRDKVCSVARVKGPSMEPTLLDGDWVLLRKLDVSLLGRFDDNDMVRRYEWIEFGESPSRLSVGPGQVVVVQNPVTLHHDLLIKRVVGVSGQWISYPGLHPAFRFEEMRPYSVFIEGDHSDQSLDSRVLGPISKHLVQGVAEYIIWPPSRWGQIETREATDEKGQPRAVWSWDESM